MSMITPLFFILALLAAGVMGFAIQRGATCSVTAVDEIVSRRGTKRLVALLEAAVWVAVGLGLAQHFHLLNSLPGGYAVTSWTFFGAMILGLGAYINGACVVGVIARLGIGQWVFALTPIGYFLGCLSMQVIFGMPMHTATPSTSAMALAASAALWPLAALLIWRIYKIFTRTRQANSDTAWSPHMATIVIGFAFLATVILSEKWTYTEVLSELAHGMLQNINGRIGMAAALFAGAVVGGKTAGKFCWTTPSITAALRCLLGGAMMAWGSLLIPGSNDGLILIGMPLLWPYAWLAFFTMCLSIASAQLATRYFFNSQV
ncbi:YeeE/YedE thiosulfate transporter family protein [Solimicrobium silvestre]|uniref:Uncharacterized protein n=1 Tax=Solimicrobium silvestre TaxID=2099400 RepID=A0A2S9GW61_9BURK|nr:YeeE/YedE thiosulfate transporter family protein [Solimicrobium silvestre]PRC91965.1 hypothetical protein S2091_3307 [Solimicrobium silvestre]